MGQIIIDLPSRIKRRYRLDDAELIKTILQSLEVAASPVKTNPGGVGKLTAEDLADIRAAKRARKGDLVDWKDAKAFLKTLD